MDRAGYCFGSTLGQSTFDNSDCIGKSVSLAPDWSQFVQTIQQREKYFDCRVNTRQTQLFVEDAWVRRGLAHLPIVDEFESACVGFIGKPIAVLSGHATGFPVSAYIDAGDTVFFGHLPVQDWSYVTIWSPGSVVKGGGWINSASTRLGCEQWAG